MKWRWYAKRVTALDLEGWLKEIQAQINTAEIVAVAVLNDDFPPGPLYCLVVWRVWE